MSRADGERKSSRTSSGGLPVVTSSGFSKEALPGRCQVFSLMKEPPFSLSQLCHWFVHTCQNVAAANVGRCAERLSALQGRAAELFLPSPTLYSPHLCTVPL